MSHKFAASGPYPGGSVVVVDKNSLSRSQDGTWQNPYRTIQAALNAMPAISGAGSSAYTINVVPGIYAENLALPAYGSITIASTGGPGSFVTIGDGAAFGDVAWTPADPSPVLSDIRVKFSDVMLSKSIWITCSARLGARIAYLDMERSFVAGSIQVPADVASGVQMQVKLERVEVMGASTLDALLTCHNSTFQGLLTIHGTSDWGVRNSTLNGGLTVSTVDAVVEGCEIGGNTEFTSAAALRNVSVSGTLRLLSQGTLRDVTVTGGATLDDVEVISGCKFFSTLTLTGATVTPRITDTAVEGLLTCTVIPFSMAVGSYLRGGITLGAVPTYGFFNCFVQGDVNGPPGCFVIDKVTQGIGAYNLIAPATESAY